MSRTVAAQSDLWSQQQKLAADDGDSEDRFGESVAVSSDGTTALIGAHQDEDPNGNLAGSAYIFTENEEAWSQQKITAKNGDDNDQLGVSTALSGDGTTAIIGANLAEDSNGTQAGSAYVFTESEGTWSQQQKLTANDGDSGDRFGSSVAVSNDGVTAIVGAGADGDSGGVIGGSAYVFKKIDNTWSRQQKLTVNDGDSGERFGSSIEVSSDGTTALIGAHDYGSENREEAGLGYVFSESEGTWSQQQKLTASAGRPAQTADFGTSVTISDDGTTALIGVRFDEPEPSGQDTGSAYVFTESEGTWSQQQKITANDGDSGDNFGSTVAVSNDGTTALIGAFLDADPNGPEAGSAYVFTRSDGRWSQQQKLSAADGNNEDFFGESVAVSSDGTTALIGAFGDEDPNGEEAGSAYVFSNQKAGAKKDFDPEVHGFGFPNWGGTDGCRTEVTPATRSRSCNSETFSLPFDNPLTLAEARDYVKESYSSLAPAIREIQARLLYQFVARQTVTDGHCYGMVFAAQQYFQTPEALPAGADTASDAPRPTGPFESIGRQIRAYHTSQVISGEVYQFLWGSKLGVVDLQNSKQALLKTLDQQPTVPVALDSSTAGAHQLLVYDYSQANDSTTFDVYDPNYAADASTYDPAAPNEIKGRRQLRVDSQTAELTGLYATYDTYTPLDVALNTTLVDGILTVNSLSELFAPLGNAISWELNSPASLTVDAPDTATVIRGAGELVDQSRVADAATVIGAAPEEVGVAVNGEGTGEYTLTTYGVEEGTAVVEDQATGRITPEETIQYQVQPASGSGDGGLKREARADSPLDGTAGEYDANNDGTITASELGNAVTDFGQGELTASELGEVVTAFGQS